MPTALVTGASRGIGKAIAIHLARAGFDVALMARTEQDGERREHSSTIRRSDTSPLPGSLASTAALVEAEGRRALIVAGDLTKRESVVIVARTVLEQWGHIDVLVNNGRYLGPGNVDMFIDTPLELLDAHLEANVMAPLALIKELLPSMLARGSGYIVNVTTGAAFRDTTTRAGEGGWSLGYAISKGALHRVAGVLAVELGDSGIRAYNVLPGFTATERIAQDMAEFGLDASKGAPADVVGAVIAWLATTPDAADPNGRNIESQVICRELGLLPSWI